MNPLPASHAPRAVLAAALGLAALAPAQDGRPVALVNARILTMAAAAEDDGDADPAVDAVVEDGMILIRDGRIVEVGRDLRLPPGARIVDAHGGTVMPGLVHVWSTAGVEQAGGGRSLPANIPARFRNRFRGRRSGNSKPVATAAKKVAAQVYARQDVFGELLGKGVTTLVVHPSGQGFPGLAARLDPSAERRDAMVLDDASYVVIEPANTAAVAKVLKETFEKAQKVVAERNEPAKKPAKKDEEQAEAGDEGKEGEQPKEGEESQEGEEKEGEGQEGEEKEEGKGEQKPEQKPEQKKKAKKKDPNLEVLADLLEGKRRAFVELSSAADLLHYESALRELEDLDFPKVVVAASPNERSGRLEQVADKVAALDAVVLMPPSLSTLPNTQTLVNSARELHDAGIRIGFLLDDSERGLSGLWFELMELVRCGLPADAALAGVTRVPAEAAGLADEVGSIEPGRRADLLLFSGDPLDPSSRLVTVFHGGREVEEEISR